TCVTMRVLKSGFLELTLDRQSGAPAGAEASNPRCNGAGFKILNCTLGNTRSRGILVKGDNGLIEGCDISGCGMSAISIGPEYYWREADYSQDVTVRGNLLRNNVLNGGAEGVVYVHGEGAIGNRNITIAGNNFVRNYGQNDVYIEDADAVFVSRNLFFQAQLPLPNGKGRNILELKSTTNLDLWRNTVKNAATNDTLVKIDKNVEGLRGNDASGIRP
ncbi:MAG TPA: right-handed parallel beta-helix repeat-containing protein, partial [Alphaproteobacteria bacterium]|nr:right-handed parallel beta-helix repeat-containing protein [Alphaproteobacteria bacterium]